MQVLEDNEPNNQSLILDENVAIDTQPDITIPSTRKRSNPDSSEDYSSIQEEKKLDLKQVPSILPTVAS